MTHIEKMSNPTDQKSLDKLDVNQLEFGPLFGNPEKATPLTNAEVSDILEQRYQTLASEERQDEITEVFENARMYCSQVSFGVKASTVKEVKWIIREKEVEAKPKRKLHLFEIASLINLTPENYEQATFLIPSLLDFESQSDRQFVEDIVNEVRDKCGVA